jgi:hypothetical protein
MAPSLNAGMTRELAMRLKESDRMFSMIMPGRESALNIHDLLPEGI